MVRPTLIRADCLGSSHSLRPSNNDTRLIRNNSTPSTSMKAVSPTSQRATRQWVSTSMLKVAYATGNGLRMRLRPGSSASSVSSRCAALLTSDGWSHSANPMTKNSYGVWECYVPSKAGSCAIPHDSMIKISMTLPSGVSIDRIPVWINRVTQDLNISPIYEGRFWNPPETYQFKHGHSTRSVDGLKIYEAHGESLYERS